VNAPFCISAGQKQLTIAATATTLPHFKSAAPATPVAASIAVDNALRARTSHRTYGFSAQIIDSFGRPTVPIGGDHQFGSKSPKARRPLADIKIGVITMTRDEIFPSTYYKAADVRDGPIALTIGHVTMEPVGEAANKTDKAVAHFAEENSKRLVLSPTKFDAVALIAKSDETEDWSGTKIVLEAGKAMFQGKLVDCINVRAPRKAVPPKPAKEHPTAPVAPSAAAGEPDFDDEVPF
jgi:hypothetical protein